MKYDYSNLQGPLGFWKFPILKKLSSFGQKAKQKLFYSIKDHKVLEGEPAYINDYTIYLNDSIIPMRIEFEYDVLTHSTFIWQSTGNVYHEHDQEFLSGQQYILGEGDIRYMQEWGLDIYFEQIDPVGPRK